jgi:hypothetical protein
MSAAAQTRIFGIRVGVDPKILVGGLIVLAAILFWYNSRGDEETNAPAAARVTTTAPPAPAVRARTTRRPAARLADRGTLRLRPVDPTRGDVDPTLRLDLLARLQTVPELTGGRNLFELGPAPLTPEQKAAIANAPKITPGPLHPPVVAPVTPSVPVVDIPLKYYGFVKPGDKKQTNRGFFLDGENILVASEGDVVKQRYLVVELTPNSARMEDVNLKQGQTLPVVPVAQP